MTTAPVEENVPLERSVWRFHDSALPLEERLDELMGLLTLEEKIGQMMHANPAVERLGIPEYNWWNEACHGVGRAGAATVFPQVIGLAASWDRSLVRAVADATAEEAIAKHEDAARRGWRGQYRGLTFWTPNVNLFRDPRWGRGQETFGEDPFLTGELGAEMVRGLQGDEAGLLKTSACAKHFAVHSGPEAQRHTFDACPSAKDLWESYLPAFKALVDAGVEAVMGAYNRTLGEACCASELLMEDVLRGAWGFEGHYVSDCGAIDDFHKSHGLTNTAEESAALAIGRGCDLNCGCTYLHTLAAVRSGLLSAAAIDRSVRRLLRTKLKLGLLDDPSRPSRRPRPLDIVECAAHRELARRAAAESLVLVKNRAKTLPLPTEAERVLVVGPQAANLGALLGNYHGISGKLVTVLQGIIEALPANTALKYRPGCPILSEQSPGVNYTFDAACVSDYVIAVLGLDHTLEGEEGDAVASISGGDRNRIELPDTQLQFLRGLRPFCKKLVVVLTGGSAIAAPEVHELADAVILCWYPGCEGGHAVADALFGKISPSGRMPVTVPYRTDDLPPFDDYSMKGRTYKFATTEPLYPFGFGLGYGEVAYLSVVADRIHVGQGECFELRATVENRSDLVLEEVAQCYFKPLFWWLDAPQAQLVGFERIALQPKERRDVFFRLRVDALGLFDPDGVKRYQPGDYEFSVGPSSPSLRAIELGAAKPARMTLTLVSE